MRAHSFAVVLSALFAVGAVACGASEPREEDIYHDPALRPSFLEPQSDAERALLAELGSEPEAGAVQIAGASFLLGAPYYAASGRVCRAVAAPAARRLACQTEDGWRFVPLLDRVR